MNEKHEALAAVQPQPDVADLTDFVDYEDGGDLVICDRENARAWVRSDATVPIEA